MLEIGSDKIAKIGRTDKRGLKFKVCSLKCPRPADKLENVNKMLFTNSSTNYKILWFPNQQPGIKIRKGKEEDFDLCKGKNV